MRIYLVDKQEYFKVTFEETMSVLRSGLEPHQWTEKEIIILTKQNN